MSSPGAQPSPLVPDDGDPLLQEEESTVFFATVIFMLTWLLTFRKWSWLPVGRTTGALIGASLMIHTGCVSTIEAHQSVKLGIVLFLLGLKIMMGMFEKKGFVDYLAHVLTYGNLTPLGLLARVSLTAGLLSCFIMSEGAALFLSMVVLAVCGKFNLPRTPYMIAVATSANIGGTATVIGSLANILIFNEASPELGFLRFSSRMGAPAFLGVLLNTGLLLAYYRTTLMAASPSEQQQQQQALAEVGKANGHGRHKRNSGKLNGAYSSSDSDTEAVDHANGAIKQEQESHFNRMLARRDADSLRQRLRLRRSKVNVSRQPSAEHVGEASSLLLRQERLRAQFNRPSGYGATATARSSGPSPAKTPHEDQPATTAAAPAQYDVSQMAVRMAASGVKPYFPPPASKLKQQQLRGDREALGPKLDLWGMFSMNAEGNLVAKDEYGLSGYASQAHGVVAGGPAQPLLPTLAAGDEQDMGLDGDDEDGDSRRRRRRGPDGVGEYSDDGYHNQGNESSSTVDRHQLQLKKSVRQQRLRQRRKRNVKRKVMERKRREKVVLQSGSGTHWLWFWCTTHVVELAHTVVFGAMFTLFCLGWDLGWTCVGAAMILVMLERVDPVRLFDEVNYPRLFYLVGLFVVVSAFNQTWLPGWVWTSITKDVHKGSGTLGFSVLSLCVVSIVATYAFTPVLAILLVSHQLQGLQVELSWLVMGWTVAMCGNLSSVGSMAGVTVTQASRPFEPIPWLEWLRFSALSTAIILPTGLIWLVVTAVPNKLSGELDSLSSA